MKDYTLKTKTLRQEVENKTEVESTYMYQKNTVKISLLSKVIDRDNVMDFYQNPNIIFHGYRKNNP